MTEKSKLLMIGALLVSPVAAETRLTLSEAVAQAIASHPLITASEQQVAVSEGAGRQAGMAPNPHVTFQHENIRSSPDPSTPYWSWTDTFAMVEQTIETGGKRDRRKESAAANVERAVLQLELLRKQIAGRVKRAYWQAAGAHRIQDQLERSAENFQQTVRYHEARVREGAMAEADLWRIQLASERLKLSASTALLEAERNRIRLFREMGQAEIPDHVAFDELAVDEKEAVTADPQQALGNRTEMKLARLAVRAAEAELRLARTMAKPDLGVIAGYKRTAGYDTLLAGVKMELPLFNRNQGNISAAGSMIEALRAELASMAAVVRAELAVARKGREIRRQQIVGSLEPMLIKARETAELAQAAYREGGSDLLRLLDAERLRIETETLYYEALAEYRQSIAELEIAMGVEP